MAHELDHPAGHGAEEHAVHHSHAKLYIQIFFFLLAVTGIEIAIPIFHEELGISKIPEVAMLLSLMLLKGTFVVMFYMHLKGDRKMFGSLFVFPLIIVLLMVIVFLLLFKPVFG
jgi:cytochrome c oxidase subunit 4